MFKMNLLLFLCSIVAVQTGAAAVLEDHHRSGEELGTTSPFVKIKKAKECRIVDLYATPAVIFIVNHYENTVLRCLLANPKECEVFYKGNTPINDIVISDNYIYVATVSSTILRCDLYRKDSCSTFYTESGKFEVLSLSAVDGYLYACQDYPSKILRCDLNKPNSCHLLYETDQWIWSLIQIGKNLYYGKNGGKVIRCSLSADSSCTVYDTNGGDTRSIVSTAHTIYALSWAHDLRQCSLKSDASIDECHEVPLNFNSTWDVALYNDQMYFANEDGIYMCKLTDMSNCTRVHDGQLTYPRIAIAYESHRIQNKFTNEQNTSPSLVKYYGSHERGWLEVYVKNEKLYDSRGYLVDTTYADKGHSGPAAIFAMSPAGRLLLSNVHSSQEIRTSSFFAGSPVAGAGEMTVINGVIKKIAACDDYYLADADLNKQVIQSLRMKGYTDPIESETCHEENDNEQQI